MRPACRIVIIDDHPLMAEALRRLLDAGQAFAVAGVAGDLGAGAALVAIEQPDIVIAHLARDEDASRLVADIADRTAGARVLVMVDEHRAGATLDGLAAHAAGVLTSQATGQDVLEAIHVVLEGGTAISPTVAAALVRAYRRHGSSDRNAPADERTQRAVEFAVSGSTDLEIAAEMGVSPRTVQRLLAGARRNAGVRRRSDLVRWATLESVAA